MRSLFALLTFACAIVAAAAVSPAASPQDRVPYPGLMTQGKIWIQNTGRAEAVPVVIENMAKDTAPLRVEVLGTTAVALAPGAVLQAQTRAARQQWEHRSITVASGQDAGTALANAGGEGWEAVGVQPGAQGSTVVLLKRPRGEP